MGKTYLLIEEQSTNSSVQSFNRMVVEAPDKQEVKHHWHEVQNDIGGIKATEHKHCYEHHDLGYWVEIDGIIELSDNEADVLSEHLPKL